MENADEDAAGKNPASPPENPNPRPVVVGDTAPTPAPPSRTPFTSLSQVDADLALARRLQEQVLAFDSAFVFDFLSWLELGFWFLL